MSRAAPPFACPLLLVLAGGFGSAAVISTAAGEAVSVSATSTSTAMYGRDRLAIEQLPAAVRNTLTRESDGAAISDIERKRKQNRDVYRARLRGPDGKSWRITIAEDGSVISRKKS